MISICPISLGYTGRQCGGAGDTLAKKVRALGDSRLLGFAIHCTTNLAFINGVDGMDRYPLVFSLV